MVLVQGLRQLEVPLHVVLHQRVAVQDVVEAGAGEKLGLGQRGDDQTPAKVLSFTVGESLPIAGLK